MHQRDVSFGRFFGDSLYNLSERAQETYGVKVIYSSINLSQDSQMYEMRHTQLVFMLHIVTVYIYVCQIYILMLQVISSRSSEVLNIFNREHFLLTHVITSLIIYIRRNHINNNELIFSTTPLPIVVIYIYFLTLNY